MMDKDSGEFVDVVSLHQKPVVPISVYRIECDALQEPQGKGAKPCWISCWSRNKGGKRALKLAPERKQ